MSQGTDYEFEWDDAKAEGNFTKHGVDFMEAMSVLRDPLLMTRFDDDHSEDEDRWVSLGRASSGKLLLVVHTYTAVSAQHVLVQMISARRPTKREARQYAEG